MEKDVNLKLQEIRECMKDNKIDAYIIKSSDYHGSEYVSDFFKCREYVTGFKGSAGTAVILEKEAGLWTDGRYFLQAEKELENSGFQLYREGEENVPDIETFLLQILPNSSCVGIDGKTISVTEYRKMKKKLKEKNINICLDYDIMGSIWKERPKLSCEKAWELDACYAGKSRKEKISEIQKKLIEKGTQATLISALDDIAWILNIRGNDIACTPLVLSYLIITRESVMWFVQSNAVSEDLKNKLKNDKIHFYRYFEIYDFLSKDTNIVSLYIDPNRTNVLLYKKAKKRSNTEKRMILEGEDLAFLSKAIKNNTEINNERMAHIKDAVACTKFIFWLKTNIINQTSKITEISAAKKLEEFRLAQQHYLGPSFHTISAYAEHGAIVHYRASSDTDKILKAENMLLIDSGGQYLEGTTDITRTIALGQLSKEMRHQYTLVLKGNIRLATAKFTYGYTGINLDYLARQTLAEEGYDYNHGTGHGVGYLSCVHEGPNNIRNKITRKEGEAKLEAGMITSNEPGLYITGKYGIRLENLILCKEIERNEFGKFMGFETLTLVPFERDAIEFEELSKREREWLNKYHAEVYRRISPYLSCDEQVWLREVTKEA